MYHGFNYCRQRGWTGRLAKITKYADLPTTHNFVPTVIESLGSTNSTGLEFIKEIGNGLQSKPMTQWRLHICSSAFQSARSGILQKHLGQCCSTFLTLRAAQNIIMKPRAAPVNSKVTTKICWALGPIYCNFVIVMFWNTMLSITYAHDTFDKCYPSSVTNCHKSRTPPLKYVTFSRAYMYVQISNSHVWFKL